MGLCWTPRVLEKKKETRGADLRTNLEHTWGGGAMIILYGPLYEGGTLK